MLKILRYFIITFSVVTCIGCAAHSNIVPLGKGNMEVSAGAGGPFLTVKTIKVPAPYFTLAGTYGLRENMNIDATIHMTAFFYKVAGFDLGAAWFPVLNKGLIPTWGIQPRLMVFASLKSGIRDSYRIYPFISSSAAWKTGSGFAYAGFDLVLPLTRPDYDKESPHYIISPFAGYRWKLGKLTNLFTEVKWSAANVPGNMTAAEYLSPGGYGALAVLFTISRSF